MPPYHNVSVCTCFTFKFPLFSTNHLGRIRKIAKELSFRVFGNLATEVSQAVGNNQKTNVELHVVGGNLVENFLCDSHLGCLALNNQTRIGLSVENNHIAAFLKSVEGYGVLRGHQPWRKTQCNKVLYNVLPDPLFGRQSDKFVAQRVENLHGFQIDTQLLRVVG